MQELSLKTAATLLACGIDPDKSTLFVQSNVPAHTEMMWFLSTMTPLSWLNNKFPAYQANLVVSNCVDPNLWKVCSLIFKLVLSTT